MRFNLNKKVTPLDWPLNPEPVAYDSSVLTTIPCTTDGYCRLEEKFVTYAKSMIKSLLYKTIVKHAVVNIVFFNIKTGSGWVATTKLNFS